MKKHSDILKALFSNIVIIEKEMIRCNVNSFSYLLKKRRKVLGNRCVLDTVYETEWLALEPFQSHNPYENSLSIQIGGGSSVNYV